MGASDVSIRVVTPSFRGDFERYAALCASFDTFAAPEFHHQVIVPRRDLARFKALGGPRREILCVEDVLPVRALHLPVRKERWLLDYRHRHGGWLVQQLVKVAAARPDGVDAVVFADSDLVVVRPLKASHFLADGRVRLYQIPGTGHYDIDPNYAKWFRGAGQLLDVTVEERYPKSYVGPLVSWLPALAVAMCERIERVSGRGWIEAIGRLRDGAGFSEYTTYGVFVERADPEAMAGHVAMPGRLCHVSWEFDISTPAGRDAFLAALAPENVAVLIQSNLRLPMAEWRGLLAALPRTSPGHAPAADMP
jgi:Family of unknown function (DUF6492)